MAQKVQVLLVDDIDGGTADETVTFGLDGVSYEIDLTTAHAAELRDALATWVGHARKVGGRSSSGRGTSGAASRPRRSSDAGAVRTWAKENGYDVSERGRISAEIREAYEAAQG
ncbi:Lsr2 family protein [Cellulomonas sp. NPDC058312]|uniref:histone-like nucleoid-structuring protein Lsr2 n=1 Tax=Cellulomonas sp. NPDC058312 TaxID=3346441 RepID=UPI0036EE8A41